MNKNFRLKEMSDWIKRSLKNKLSITKSLIIRILMCGAFMSFSIASYSDWWAFKIDKDTGAASHDNDAGKKVEERGSILIAKTRGDDIIAQANRTIYHGVIIGVNSYSIGQESSIIGYNSKGVGSQAQVLGSNSAAGSQSVAIGSETFATGSSSIAIGSDDIYDNGSGLEDKLPQETIKKIYEDLWTKKHELKGEKGKLYKGTIFNNEEEFNNKYGIVKDGIVENGIKRDKDSRIYSPTFSRGLGSIAMGSRTVAYGNQSTALGTLNFALANKSTAIGTRSFVDFNATGATAIGEESRVFAENSVAVGNQTEATNKGSMAYGYLSKAVGEGSVAIGHTVGSNAKLTEASKNKFESNLNEIHNDNKIKEILDGDDDKVSSIIKNTTKNNGKDVIEYEEEDKTVLTTTKAIHKTKKQNDNAITLGNNSISNGLNSTVIGSSTAVFGSNSIGIGSLINITEQAKNSIALGTATRIKSKNSMALGVGSSIEENSDKSIAFGAGAKVTKNTTSGMALGDGAVANMANSVALGVNSKTDYGQDKLNKPGWAPLGSLSTPTSSKVGVVSVGSINNERRITNVSAGYALTDAANISQLKALDDKINKISSGDYDSSSGVRYMSVDRNSDGSNASKLHEIGQKQTNFNNYVEAKAQKLLIEARTKLNGEKFEDSALAQINETIDKLKDKPGVQEHVKKLKEAENKLNNLSASDKSKFDEIMSEIEKAKKEDLKEDVLTVEEKAKLADSNYNNNGAKGKDSIAIGYGAKAENTSDQGLAIGFMSKSTEKDTVALGSQSVANTKAGIAGYDPTTKTNSTKDDMAWKSTLGALSIGDVSKGLTRQIVGVAAGTEDTDAVNVAQLKQLKEYVKNNSSNNKSIQDKLDKKANIDASNLEDKDVEKWQSTLGNGKVEKDNKGLVTGETIYNKLNEVKTELNKSISSNTQNITELNKKYTTLNNQVTTNTGDITELKTTVDGLKNTTQDITNINTKLDGKLDKSDLSITGDDYIKVNKDNKFNYTLSFNKTKLESELDLTNNATLNNKFNKYALLDGSNLDNTNVTKWQNKLGNGDIAKDNKGLVTGGTVYDKLNEVKTELNGRITANEGKITDINNKYNKLSEQVTTNTGDITELKTTVKGLKNTTQDITNINTKLEGKLDKSDLSIKGDDYITATKGEKFNYTLSFNKTKLEKDLDLTNNATLNNKFNKYALLDGSNLDNTNVTKWQNKLGNGDIAKDNKGLVTGGTVHDKLNEVKTELNKSISTNTKNITELNNKYTTLNNQVTTNTNDIKQLKTTVDDLKNTTKDITNIKNKLGDIDNSINNINTKLDGKLDKNDFSIKGDDYITATKDNKFNYTMSLNKDKLASDLDLTKNTSINNMFNTKLGDINKNLGGLKTQVETNTNNINTLTTKVDNNTKNIEKLNQDMTKKLDVDASNLSTDGENNLINKLSKGSDISNPKNRLVTDKQVSEHLDKNYYNKTYVDEKIKNISNTVGEANKKSELALGGVANAVAMANLVQVNSYSRHRHNLSAAYGYYGGSHALAIGFSGTNEERNFVYKLSGSVNNKGNLAFGVGAGVMLGEEHDTFTSIDNKKIKEVTKKLDEANKKISEYEDDKKQTAKKFKELEAKYENDKKESNKKLQEMERKLEMLMKKFK